MFSRNAERGLLSAAADTGVETLINRPFGEGSHFSKIKNIPLLPWADEYAIKSWSQWFLVYIISILKETVVIPAIGSPSTRRSEFCDSKRSDA